MIASADFLPATATLEFNAGLELPYSDDRLVPDADPYIAQLFADHQVEVAAQRAWDVGSVPPARSRFSEMQLAFA